MSRVLITGGAGFIGTATAKKLLRRGHEVVTFDNLQPPVHPKAWDPRGAPGSVFYPGDVRSEQDLKHALRNVDTVLHLAAYQDFRADWSTFFETNSAGTARIYELIVRDKLDIERVVCASTQALLGDGAYDCKNCGKHFFGRSRKPEDMALGEWRIECPKCYSFETEPAWTREHEVAPAIPYGVSKLAAEQISTILGRNYDIPTVNLRYSIVQGPTQSPKNAYSGVLRAVALQVLGGAKEVVVFEDGLQQRDFVSINDVVRANVYAVEGRVAPGAYNVGGGQAYTVKQLAEAIIDIAGSAAQVVTPGYYRVGDIRHTLSYVKRMTQSGWQPTDVMGNVWVSYWDWLHGVIKPGEARETVEAAFSGMLSSGSMRKVEAA